MASDHLKLLVGGEFPFPIAYWFRRTTDEGDEGQSREFACSFIQATLELIGSILVCDYLSLEEQDPDLDVEVSRLFDRPPTVGVWRDWILRVLEWQRKRGREPFLPALGGLLDHHLERELSHLIEWRNRWVHMNAHFELGAFRKSITTLLGGLRPLHQISLFSTHSTQLSGPLYFTQATLFRGESPLFPVVECRSEQPLETDQVYVYSAESGEILSLHPLIVHERCDRCGERHYFQFNRVTRGKVNYGSIPHAHEKTSAEAFGRLEQLTRHRRPKRLHFRHFSLPGIARTVRTLRPGDRIGEYRVEELINLGGLAQIYRVTDSRDGKEHALKLLPIEYSRDPILLSRFDEEALNLKRLRHPHIVALEALGEDFGDRYLVMELAFGGRIESQRVRDLSQTRKPLRESTIISVARQVCEGLQFIHSQGVIHRDLKPGNLLVSGDRILIGDFGIARSRNNSKLTLNGMPVGTPDYMSPEQFQQTEVDHRADLYSLGCVLYELATGRLPFRTDAPLATAYHHLQASPPHPRSLNEDISPGLSNIIMKALQKSPRLRQGSAKELYEELLHVGQDPAGPQVIEGDRMPQDLLDQVRAREKQKYRRNLFWRSVAAAVLLLSLGIGVLVQKVKVDLAVRSGIAAAGAAWEGSRGTWSSSGAWVDLATGLRQSIVLDRHHPSVRDLLVGAFTRGSVTVRTEPEDLEFEVSPERRIGKDLELGPLWEPQLLVEDRRFKSGETVPVAIGHYRVSFFRSGTRLPAEALVWVGHRRCELVAGSWLWRAVPHQETARVNPALTGPDVLYVANDVTIGPFPVPQSIPSGYAYVNPGLTWTAPEPAEISEKYRAEPTGKGRIRVTEYDGTRFPARPVEIKHGFFIAQDETTIGQVKEWFGKFGSAWCALRIDRDAQLYKARFDTRLVPLEVQRESWRAVLARRNISVDSLKSQEEILSAVFEKQHRHWEKHWRCFEKAMCAYLDDPQTSPSQPVGGVFRDLAAAYARTHAKVDARELEAWLRLEALRSVEAAEALEWTRTIVEAMPGRLVDVRGLPVNVGFRCRYGCRDETLESLVASYAAWIELGAYYAWQLPVESITAWARRQGSDSDLPLLARAQEVAKPLQEPSCWVWRTDFFEDDTQNQKKETPVHVQNHSDLHTLIQYYARALKGGNETPERAHFLRWLGWRAEEEMRRASEFEEFLARIDRPNADLERMLGDRFDLFLEFGLAMGWGLPEAVEWERAFRGVDARPYPWGDDLDRNACRVSRIDGARPLTVEQARTSGRDVSPFRVFAMAGNMSEWVVCPEASEGIEQFLKGSHSDADADHAHAGYYFSMQGGNHCPWTGFRVVRVIKTLPSVEYEKAKAGRGSPRGKKTESNHGGL